MIKKTEKNKLEAKEEKEKEETEQNETIQEIVTPVKFGGMQPNGEIYKYQVVFDRDTDDSYELWLLSDMELQIHHSYLMTLKFLVEENNIRAFKSHEITLITENDEIDNIDNIDNIDHEEYEPQPDQIGTESIDIDGENNIITIKGERQTYEQNSPALRGDMPLKITYEDVKEHLAPDNATDSEIKLFIQFCLTNQLDPFSNDAYMIKYNNSKSATFHVSKDLYLKRADQLSDYRGFEAGIIVFNPKIQKLEEREGSFYMKSAGETLVGAYAIVYRQGMRPFKAMVSRDEYDKKQFIWKDKPATMLRKVAIAQALRDAFPNAYSGLYMQEEMTDRD